ncbi:MAG: hypothetical protein FWF00_04415 [Endomicrobia bacterium]|nr:hypothetical protein [Endomicrobiia bacterium]MCL2506914.1 hypothetical protein [Endomicrobiia bacterium]
MFYNKKWLFLIILYAMSMALYYFIDKQLILTGFMSGVLIGSIIIFALIAITCFLIALIVSIIARVSYIAGCGLFKVSPKEMLAKTFWTIFTVLSYAAVFIVFLKMIEY